MSGLGLGFRVEGLRTLPLRMAESNGKEHAKQKHGGYFSAVIRVIL